MAGGMSFGAFGGRADVMDLFDAHRPGALIHSGTFNNNVMTMAGGMVAMGEIFDAAAAEALFARGEDGACETERHLPRRAPSTCTSAAWVA